LEAQGREVKASLLWQIGPLATKQALPHFQVEKVRYGLKLVHIVLSLPERSQNMALFSKEGKTVTRHQKGRRWATATLVVCGAFSIWANVRSGALHTDSVVVSVLPPVVAFLTSHLVTYFNPVKLGQRLMIWGGMGSITILAMVGSGTHIVDTVTRTGQHWIIGVTYVFITDAPMLLSAAILIDKVPTAQLAANRTSATIPVKKAATPAKKATPAKTAVPKKTAQTPKVAKAAIPDIFSDPIEKDMLAA
jgi:hypothetical protein